MALDYSEKRDFFRMNMDCTLEYRVNGSGIQAGQIRNLSGNGIAFLADKAIEPGTEVQICIKPQNGITPPLDVIIEVLRCHQDGKQFEIAGNITRR